MSIFQTRDAQQIKTAPKLIILTSENGGDPGVKEPLIREKSILQKSTSILTLITPNDMEKLSNLANQTTTVLYTPSEYPSVFFGGGSIAFTKFALFDKMSDYTNSSLAVLYGSYGRLYLGSPTL